MAKLDDFGRPIYETAEDYNQAHKGGVCPRPYDSPVGENYQQKQSASKRYVKQANSYKTKVLLGGVFGVFALVFLIVVGIRMINSPSERYDESWAETQVGMDVVLTEMNLGTADFPLPEGFEKFKYNGYPCTLPACFEDIRVMGFHITDFDMISGLIRPEYEEMWDIYNEMGRPIGMIRINNHTYKNLLIGECMVDYFSIVNPALYDDTETIPNFKFGNGLTFKSSYEEVEAYFGTPYYYNAYESNGSLCEHYEWAYYGEDEMHIVTVDFHDGAMYEVSIEKCVYE